jgi:hypothetical protein
MRRPAGRRVRLTVQLRPTSDAQMLSTVTIREDARVAGFVELRKGGAGIFTTRAQLPRFRAPTRRCGKLRASNRVFSASCTHT